MPGTYDLIALHSQPHAEPSSKYFGLSMFIHTAIAVGALFVTVPMMEDLKKEVITIELQTEQPAPPPPQVVKTIAIPDGEKVKPTRGAKAIAAPAAAAPLHAELDSVVKGPAKTAKKSFAKASKMKTHTGSGAKHVAAAKSAPSRAGVPETIEDIAADDLDFDGVVAAQHGKLGDDAFEDDFKNIDKSNAAALQAQRSEMDDELKQVADEKDEALQALEEENKQAARAMQNALEAKRTKNAAAIAQLKASEAAAAAREKAAREQALAQAQAAAKARGQSQLGGRGAGSNGDDESAKVASGEPNQVRSLDQLRQMPGNPKPQYSVEERFQRQQGLVAFHAYISKSGLPSQFRLTKSTGFRNLDGKTLAALKKWKFYPGQEGWVEIPMQWDIKGGVQEMPTLLRRSRYGSN